MNYNQATCVPMQLEYYYWFTAISASYMLKFETKMSPISDVIFMENTFVTCSSCGNSIFQKSHSHSLKCNHHRKEKNHREHRLLNKFVLHMCLHFEIAENLRCILKGTKLSEISSNNQICILNIWVHNDVCLVCLTIMRYSLGAKDLFD